MHVHVQDARNELRRQIGTLRFDLNNLADDRNLSRDRNKEIMQQLEDVDYFLRQKNQDRARQKLEPLRQQVNQLLS
jgi:photosystem II oxygen-evolving enhancer protein 3